MKPLDGERLVQLRELRGISQKNLAKLAKVSQRQLVRIESTPKGKSQNKTIESLAKVLKVDQGVLTGDLPIPQDLTVDDRKGFATVSEEQATISVKVSYDIRNWYDLVRHFYGVSMSDLVRVAPLLLVLLAERGKKWQEQEIAATMVLLEQIKEKTKGLPASTDIDMQCFDIEGKLPFITKLGHNLTTDHAFLWYLRSQAKEIKNVRAESIGFHQSDFVSYDLFQDEQDWARLQPLFKEKIRKGEIRFFKTQELLALWNLRDFLNLLKEIHEETNLDLEPLFKTILSIELTKEKLKKSCGEFFSSKYFPEEIWEFLEKKDGQETFIIKEIWDADPYPNDIVELMIEPIGKLLVYFDETVENEYEDKENARILPRIVFHNITSEVVDEIRSLCGSLEKVEVKGVEGDQNRKKIDSLLIPNIPIITSAIKNISSEVLNGIIRTEIFRLFSVPEELLEQDRPEQKAKIAAELTRLKVG